MAAAHDVAVRVLDLGSTRTSMTCLNRTAFTSYKVRHGSGAIQLEDALTPEETQAALAAGERVAHEEIGSGAQLLISGDMGIGNTTPAAALVAAGLGVPGSAVAGRGTGITEDVLAHKVAVIQQALDRTGRRAEDPMESLTALGSADLTATTGYLLAAARAGVPVLLDGLMTVACALTGRAAGGRCGGVVRCRAPVHGRSPILGHGQTRTGTGA